MSAIANIQVNGIKTSIIIGCYEHERVKTQDIVIDLWASLYSHNWVSQDKLDTTVDYDELIDFTVSVVSQTTFNLLESLAQHLTNEILMRFTLIREINLTITKLAICGIKAQEIKVGYNQHKSFKVALALGSNSEFLPQQQLITTIEILGEYINDISIGGIYETKPVGYVDQRNFYNTAITGFTTLKPEELLGKIKSIEKLMGKTEILENGPRIIDIDLIFFTDLIYTHNFLTVPHKHAHLRDFVLQPLADIAPDWVHPVLNVSVKELAKKLQHESILKKVDYYKNAAIPS